MTEPVYVPWWHLRAENHSRLLAEEIERVAKASVIFWLAGIPVPLTPLYVHDSVVIEVP